MWNNLKSFVESFEVLCGVILSHLWNHFKSFVESFKVICGVIFTRFVAFWAGKSLSEGLREASGGAPEAPEAARRLPIGAKADFD